MIGKQIQSIYTDGACSGNPGPGGWGTVVYFTDGSVHEMGGSAAQTTNNRMEMQAAIAGLEYLLASEQTEPIVLYTDSEYVKNGITQWVKGWKKKGWKTAAGKPVLNQELWQTLDRLVAQIQYHKLAPIQWEYVRGHSGNEGNERCDTIARAFTLGKNPGLRQSKAEGRGQKAEGGALEINPEINPEIETSKNPNAAIENSSILSLSSTKTLPEQPNPSAKQVTPLSPPQGKDELQTSSVRLEKESHATDAILSETIQSSDESNPHCSPLDVNPTMIDSTAPIVSDASDLPREVRVTQLRNLVETLHMADEIARQGYLITSSELADLMDVNASAVTSRGDNWVWRNWVVSRVRREGNQILWQLERVD